LLEHNKNIVKLTGLCGHLYEGK